MKCLLSRRANTRRISSLCVSSIPCVSRRLIRAFKMVVIAHLPTNSCRATHVGDMLTFWWFEFLLNFETVASWQDVAVTTCLNSVQHLQPKYQEDRFLPLQKGQNAQPKHPTNINVFQLARITPDTCTRLPSPPSPYCCSPSLMAETEKKKNAATVGNSTDQQCGNNKEHPPLHHSGGSTLTAETRHEPPAPLPWSSTTGSATMFLPLRFAKSLPPHFTDKCQALEECVMMPNGHERFLSSSKWSTEK